MFIIKVTGYNTRYYIGKNYKPCNDIKNARLFKTRQGAGAYIVKHYKEYSDVINGACTMTTQEI